MEKLLIHVGLGAAGLAMVAGVVDQTAVHPSQKVSQAGLSFSVQSSTANSNQIVVKNTAAPGFSIALRPELRRPRKVRDAIDLRQHILTEIKLSERIVREGNEVVPRFTIFAPDRVRTAMVQLPNGEQQRAKQLALLD